MIKKVSFLFLLLISLLLLVNCKNGTNDDISMSYKAVSIKPTKGEYILFAYDNNTYEIKTSKDEKFANGTYSYISENTDKRISITFNEKGYLDLLTKTYTFSDKSYTVPMNNNNSEFIYSCNNGIKIWFMSESVYNLTYNN